MELKQELALFKEKVDKEIADFFDSRISDASEKDGWVAEGMDYVRKIALSGGKRIRPALVYWGYKSCGGKDEDKILKVAAAVELIHIFLLVHDDIIDRSDKRHGLETVNIWAERKSASMFEGGDRRRFGYSMAMIFGDLLYVWALQLIGQAGFDGEKTSKAVAHMQQVVYTTLIGESQDVVIEYKKNVVEDEILEMCRNKTSKYTFEGPLCLGAILAGADVGVLDSFGKYGIPVGIAFQIQDDILGVFGSEEKMGKSAASDIMEGKKTVLTAKVFSDGSIFHKERMESILGKKDLSAEEINEFQEIVMDSGALKYAKGKAVEFIAIGKEEIEKAAISQEGKDFLVALADYIIDRDI